MRSLPAAWRLLPAVLAGWVVAGVVIGTPDAALAVAGIGAVITGGLAIAARRVPVLVLAAIAGGVGVLVALSVALAAPARVPTALAEAAAEGRSAELLVVVTGRTVEGRFDGRVDGAPVLVFGEGAGPAIGATV